MDFRFSDEQRMWNDTVQDFMAREGLYHDLDVHCSEYLHSRHA
jgi:hypothetical protein